MKRRENRKEARNSFEKIFALYWEKLSYEYSVFLYPCKGGRGDIPDHLFSSLLIFSGEIFWQYQAPSGLLWDRRVRRGGRMLELGRISKSFYSGSLGEGRP